MRLRCREGELNRKLMQGRQMYGPVFHKEKVDEREGSQYYV